VLSGYVYLHTFVFAFFGLMSTNCDLCIEVSVISLSVEFCRSQAKNRVTVL